MAGANGILKLAVTNREGQFQDFQARGISFSQRTPVTVVASPMIGSVFLNDLLFPLGGIASPVTGPTAQDVYTQLSLRSVPTLLNRFEHVLENATAADMVVNMGAGFTPASFTIPANSTAEAEWELYQLSPPLYRLYRFNITNTTGAGPLTLPPGILVGDALIWSGVAWVPSSPAFLTNVLISQIRPVNPTTRLLINGGLVVNANNTRNLVGDSDFIQSTNAAQFTTTNQYLQLGVVATTGSPVDPAIAGSASYASNHQLAAPIQPSPNSPTLDGANVETLYHFLGMSGGGQPGQLRFAVTTSGQIFGGSINILSGVEVKKNIEEYKIDSHLMKDLRCVNFHYKTQTDDCEKCIGLIAEEVGKVIKGSLVVTNSPDKGNKSKFEGNYLNLNALLGFNMGVVKDLEERVTHLELENRELREQLQSLSNIIVKLDTRFKELEDSVVVKDD